jgi:hypothetical protein
MEILSHSQRTEVADRDPNNLAQTSCDLLRPTVAAIFVATTLSPIPIQNYAVGYISPPPTLPIEMKHKITRDRKISMKSWHSLFRVFAVPGGILHPPARAHEPRLLGYQYMHHRWTEVCHRRRQHSLHSTVLQVS